VQVGDLEIRAANFMWKFLKITVRKLKQSI